MIVRHPDAMHHEPAPDPDAEEYEDDFADVVTVEGAVPLDEYRLPL
jgi:hypothetical protein